ncbi:MAG TPA: hypothetical protein DDW52_08250 [Planctomycetaceae bacterium]|nr:hypothetical protein [Planctomycetaceae bacterium]
MLLVLACPACFTTLVFAQDAVTERGDSTDEAAPDEWYFGYDLFKMSLEKSGVQIVENRDLVMAKPQESIIVHLGALPDAAETRYYQSFLLDGGAILVASDQSGRGGFLSIERSIAASTDPGYWYQGHADCIVVAPTRRTDLTQRVRSLVFNRASAIRGYPIRRDIWQSEVDWPSYVDRYRGRRLVASTKESFGPGVGVIAADHSLFTNGMIWHGDNAILVLNIVKRLTTGGRAQLYFVADKRIEQSYKDRLAELVADANIPPEMLGQAPELEIEQMLRVANTVMANSEDANLLNAYLEDRPRRMSSRVYNRNLLFAVLLVMLAYLIYRLLKAGGTLAGQPRPARQVTANAPIVGLGDDLPGRRGEAARLRCRAALKHWTDDTDPVKWQRAVEGVSEPNSKAQLQRLLIVATDPPAPITQSDLFEVDWICRELVSKSNESKSRVLTG